MENFPRIATREEMYELAVVVPIADIIIKEKGVVYVYDKYKNLNDKYELPVFEVTEKLYVDNVEHPVTLIAKNKELGVLEKMTDWMADAPRAYTEEETREKFLKHVWGMIKYWETVQLQPGQTAHDRMTGLAFSILSTLDGSSIEVPGFKVSPSVHESDKEYHIERGENYYDESVDIGGCLHEMFHQFDPDRKK